MALQLSALAQAGPCLPILGFAQRRCLFTRRSVRLGNTSSLKLGQSTAAISTKGSKTDGSPDKLLALLSAGSVQDSWRMLQQSRWMCTKRCTKFIVKGRRWSACPHVTTASAPHFSDQFQTQQLLVQGLPRTAGGNFSCQQRRLLLFA